MKRLLAILLTILCLCQPAMAAIPAGLPYRITLPYVEITFKAPLSMICLTSETSASVFRQWGMDQQEVLAMMEQDGICAIIIDPWSGMEFLFYVTEWASINYDQADDMELQLISASNLKYQTQNGFTIRTSDVYRSAEHTYVFAERSLAQPDGAVENSLIMWTNQYDVQLDIVAWQMDGMDPAKLKESVKALADTVRITPVLPQVTTQELADGRIILDLGDVRYAFMPLDVRFALTRVSSRYLFERMGYDRDDDIASMEENDIFAILCDRLQRARVQLFVMRDADSQDYSGMVDFLRVAAEKNRLREGGWTVERCELLTGAEMAFVKSVISSVKEDGTQEWRLAYGTSVNGVRIEFQVFANGPTILEEVEAEVDAMVRGFHAETDE
ncbi:MAG: hypothetical protein E7327_09620 [Clostridiales bacterium]|nr:hypothetical protein [Clostridiales bacterium]